jgi:uncharacterized RDD family membrane protein YckC
VRRALTILAVVLNVVVAVFWLWLGRLIFSNFDPIYEVPVVIYVVLVGVPILSIVALVWSREGRDPGL